MQMYIIVGTSFKNDAAHVMRSNIWLFFFTTFYAYANFELDISVCSIIGTSFFLNKGWTLLYTYNYH